MDKITFFTVQKKDWGAKQHQASKLLCEYLKKNADFEVIFRLPKTPKQLRGYWRLINLILPFIRESFGEFFDAELCSDFIKKRAGYVVNVKGEILVKSLKDATKEDLNSLISKIYEICEFYEIKDYELLPEEERGLGIK